MEFEDLMKKWLNSSLFFLFWFLIYVIFGFEPTVVALLLFILVKMENKR